jgi:hypothetical protein
MLHETLAALPPELGGGGGGGAATDPSDGGGGGGSQPAAVGGSPPPLAAVVQMPRAVDPLRDLVVRAVVSLAPKPVLGTAEFRLRSCSCYGCGWR